MTRTMRTTEQDGFSELLLEQGSAPEVDLRFGPDEGRTLCLVTPSCRRAWDNADFRPVQAGKAYTGPFSRKCQAYAERFHSGSWCILDPRHGFLFPEEVIKKGHDACLFRPWTEPLRLDELRSQVMRRKLDQFDRITVLGGRRFIILVEDAFPGKRVRAPLAGIGGIGEMMHALNEALATGQKL